MSGFDDPKEVGIRAHAFKAIKAFSDEIAGARHSFDNGWQVYDLEARRIIDATNAALPFLDRRLAEALEDAVRPAEALQLCYDRGFIEDYVCGTARRAIAAAIVAATLGLPDRKVEPLRSGDATAAPTEEPF